MFILSPVMGILVDKFSSRKSPLLIGLIAQIVTTCLTAVSPNGKTAQIASRISFASTYLAFLSVAFLCFSRIFQGAAASLLWIASLTTIADTVGSGDMGKTLGVIGPVVSTGAFFGPMTGGLLLSSAGYWHTWSAAVAMIALDLILRLAMIDKPKVSTMTHEADAGTFNEAEVDRESGAQDPGKHSPLNSLTTSHAATRQPKSSSPTISTAKSPMPNRVPPLSSPAVEEATPLLASDTNLSSPSSVRPLSNLAFFLFILRQRRVLSSLIVNIILMSAFNSFNATLALHVQELFHWGPRQVGFLYLALVGPSVLLGPFAGWLRDTIGVRWPTLVGTGFATPLYVVIGLVGDKRFPLMRGELGKRIYIGALALMGVAIELTTGSCMVEGTRMALSRCSYFWRFDTNLTLTALTFSSRNRWARGAQSRHLRSAGRLLSIFFNHQHALSPCIVDRALDIRCVDREV